MVMYGYQYPCKAFSLTQKLQVAIEHLGISYEEFTVPDCPTCLSEGRMNNVHKPDLVFFGESLSSEVKDRSFRDIELSDRLLLIGTTLATYSAFRLLKSAIEHKKPVLMVNVGPSRADGMEGVEKLDIASGLIIREVATAVLGSRSTQDAIVQQMLTSGIVKPPPADDDDRSPRAAG
ncbi:hypothetical protein VNI00_000803 [Paramarasmius palmivorus]|uniref:Deacetylase sirtuin-type domain-containing protein n=1 Tax=Paramarasmius palmivorus TaxID=297713 RepID=A0AAW0E6S0_9AGAR